MTFVPTDRHIEEVKQELPPVRIEWGGDVWWGRVSGRLNQFATVTPHSRTIGKRVETILGPCFEFSWAAVCRAVVNGTALKTN